MTAAGYPKITVTTVTAVTRRAEPPFFLSEAVRRRIAGHSPALRESRGNVWHTTLQGKV